MYRNRIRKMGNMLVDGVMEALASPLTVGAAVIVGLGQGLKYTGSVKRGIQGGVATLVTLALGNGIQTVAARWLDIRNEAEE